MVFPCASMVTRARRGVKWRQPDVPAKTHFCQGWSTDGQFCLPDFLPFLSNDRILLCICCTENNRRLRGLVVRVCPEHRRAWVDLLYCLYWRCLNSNSIRKTSCSPYALRLEWAVNCFRLSATPHWVDKTVFVNVASRYHRRIIKSC